MLLCFHKNYNVLFILNNTERSNQNTNNFIKYCLKKGGSDYADDV